MLPLDMPADDIQKTVLAHENAQKWTDGAEPKRFIHVPKKIINIVV
jgi:leucyl-tRNA synthetase